MYCAYLQSKQHAYLNFATDQSLKGKSLSEKSTLMAEARRAVDDSEKEKFQSEDVDSDMECSFTPNQKRKLFFRVARRHQGDVSSYEIQNCIGHDCLIIKP